MEIRGYSESRGAAMNPSDRIIAGCNRNISENRQIIYEVERTRDKPSSQTLARARELEVKGVNRKAYALGLLELGWTEEEVGREVGATDRTIRNWKKNKWK